MKISDMIRQALEKKGFKNLKDASKVLGISPELLRVTINKGHIPKDKTLIMIANKLGLDKSVLILAAHQEKVPSEVKGFFLSPSVTKYRRGKRKYPLSEEQINYLEKILSIEEIMMLRRYRQVSEEAKTQINGYVDFMFASKRSA
jgi:peptide deformylase